jgi:hypothetical protein
MPSFSRKNVLLVDFYILRRLEPKAIKNMNNATASSAAIKIEVPILQCRLLHIHFRGDGAH